MNEETISIIDKYGIDLTTKEYVTNPAIARDNEIKECLLTLLTPEKSALLVGKPGIGKTAIVEGIAYKIKNNDVPLALQGYSVIKINFTSLLSASGDVTQNNKLDLLIKELTLREKTIIFIDETHLLINKDGGIDFANMLKPALDRGEVKMIGATTTEEYEKYILRDRAFLRRFTKVEVTEADKATTVKILLGTLPKIEKQMNIKVAYPEFVAEKFMAFIVEMTDEYKRIYETASRYPDVALALVSQAFTYAAFENSPVVSTKHFYKAIYNSKAIYPDSKEKELERFKKVFYEYIVVEKVDLNDIN